MDSIDVRILQALQEDGRLSNQDLADRIGLSPSPTLRRVRRLEREGIITGYRAVVDPAAVGRDVLAVVELTLGDHAADVVARTEQVLREHPAVVEARMIAGDGDYLLTVRVRDLAAYERFVVADLRALPSVAALRTTVVFGSVKQAAPLLPARAGGR